MENSYEEMKLYKAMHERKIKDMSQKELTEFVSSQIVQCYFMVGYQTYEEKAVGVISAKLVSDLFQCYSYLTCKEIEYCFENGAKGRLGRFNGINLWTFTTWLEKYKTSDIRQQVRKRIQDTPAKPSAVTKTEKVWKCSARHISTRLCRTVELSITPASRNWKPWSVSRILNRPEILKSRNMLVSIS